MSKILIYQYESRKKNDVPNLFALMDLNRRKCINSHIDYKFYDTYHSNIPDYWVKVFLLRDLLMTNQYEYIIWLDSDAVLHNYNTNYFYQILPKCNYLMSFSPCLYNKIFNAGVFIVSRNALQLVNDWCALYDPSRWQYKMNRWYSDGEWAGETYEQGAFIKHIIPRYRNNLLRLPLLIMQGWYPSYIASDTIFLHFMLDRKINIMNYITWIQSYYIV